MLVIDRGAVPVLDSVTCCELLHVSTLVDGNKILEAESMAAGAGTENPTAVRMVISEPPSFRIERPCS
jgi:hypothetical protein